MKKTTTRTIWLTFSRKTNDDSKHIQISLFLDNQWVHFHFWKSHSHFWYTHSQFLNSSNFETASNSTSNSAFESMQISNSNDSTFIESWFNYRRWKSFNMMKWSFSSNLSRFFRSRSSRLRFRELWLALVALLIFAVFFIFAVFSLIFFLTFSSFWRYLYAFWNESYVNIVELLSRLDFTNDSRSDFMKVMSFWMSFFMIDNLEHLINKALRENDTIVRLDIAVLELSRVERLRMCVSKVKVKFSKMRVCSLIIYFYRRNEFYLTRLKNKYAWQNNDQRWSL